MSRGRESAPGFFILISWPIGTIYLQVGKRMKAIIVLSLLLFGNTSWATPFTYDDIVNIIQTNNVMSVEALLPLLL
jgi:hypothetical protein